METFKEFRAKTVDQAIEDACRFYDVERDGLEIDILSGGSAGIFGLGAKKAAIRAKRRRRIATGATEILQEVAAASTGTLESGYGDGDAAQPAEVLDDDDEDEGVAPVILSAEELIRLEADIRATIGAMLKPMGSEPRLSVDVSSCPITVHIDDAENSGLIIGRDGQTITALQYLTNRIISKTWQRSPRIQLDAGDYRQKQEEQLLGMALFLSEKAKKSGRVQSTRPLSSFHRRVVHMALQNDKGVQTRSKGEGPMKRVLILPVKRGKVNARPFKRQDPPQAQQS